MWLTRGEKEENLQDLSRREAWLYLKNLSANNRRGTWSGLQPFEKKSGAFMVKEGATFQSTQVQHVGIRRTFFYTNTLFNPFRSIHVETKCYVTHAMAPSVSKKKTWKSMYRFWWNVPIMLRMKAWLDFDDVLNSVGFWHLIFQNSKPVSFSLRALFLA